LLKLLLPVDFSYWQFALLLLLNGLAMGAFASPNRAGVMNSLPADQRGAGGGMNSTFQSSAQVLSIGIFFTLMILGLSSTLSGALTRGLVAHGVPVAVAARVGHLPPVSVLFAAFLGYNPVQSLVGHRVLAAVPAHDRAVLTGHSFFSQLISAPFHSGLVEAFGFAAAACLVAAAASWFRGQRYVDQGGPVVPERVREPATRS
ncbi:MAG: MFS transporter, partial [Acidimicrobiales bacterium]